MSWVLRRNKLFVNVVTEVNIESSVGSKSIECFSENHEQIFLKKKKLETSGELFETS